MKRQLYYSLFHLPSVMIDQIAPPLERPIELIRDHINLPPRLKWTHDDVTPLVRIVKVLSPKNVLEFGTGRGNTTANICAISDAYVYTVNALPEQVSGEITTFVLTKDEIGSVYCEYGFQERVTQIYVDTLDFDHTRYFKSPCIDLAIIDACHDTDYVINDFMKVLPTLRESATVLLHDTHPSREEHLFGSYNACVTLRKQGFDIKHIDGTWWAIWQKKSGYSSKC